MATPSRVAIQETFDLPSRGTFEGVPAQITLRAMSLRDEKQRLASQGIGGIVDLISNCTVKPENFDAYNMCRFDLDFAMLKLRIVSHGPKYNVDVTCPYCGKHLKKEINLDDISSKSVEDDFKPEFEIGPLPVLGDTLTVKILTFRDINDIETESRRVLSKFPDYKGDPSDILNYVYKIVAINGEKVPFVKLKAYVENMPAADSVFIDEYYENALNNYGLDTVINFDCEGCNESFQRVMPMNAEFFRPRYIPTK